jgi:hypothetical protein
VELSSILWAVAVVVIVLLTWLTHAGTFEDACKSVFLWHRMLGHTYRLLERVFKHHKMLEHNMVSQGLPGYVKCG